MDTFNKLGLRRPLPATEHPSQQHVRAEKNLNHATQMQKTHMMHVTKHADFPTNQRIVMAFVQEKISGSYVPELASSIGLRTVEGGKGDVMVKVLKEPCRSPRSCLGGYSD